MKNLLAMFPLISLLIACGQGGAPKDQLARGNTVGLLKLDSSLLVVSEVAGGLDIPWELTLAPNGDLWFTEHRGTVNRLDPSTLETNTLLQIEDIHYVKSRGLLGMVLHPNFIESPHIFLHYTFAVPQANNLEKVFSRIVRYTYEPDTLVNPVMVMDSIPGNTYHNGSRLAISKDLKLFFSLGDVGYPHLAQDVKFPGGKILRLNLDGSIPEDNPFSNSPVWSWGHRNSQGMVFTPPGRLYTTDHGPHTDDEVNLIVKGGNSGWPDVRGFRDNEKEIAYARDSTIKEPLISWTPTIGISGLDYYGDQAIPEWHHSLVAASLKGQSLRVLKLNSKGDSIVNEKIYLFKRFGRIRDLCIDKNGVVYIGTSNNDWHPRLQPWLYDSLPVGGDRILRIHLQETGADASTLKALSIWTEDTLLSPLGTENWQYEASKMAIDAGEQLYLKHCASCHQADGAAAPGLIPPLAETDWVSGDKTRLIRLLLTGLSDTITVNGTIYQGEMPAYDHLEDGELASILTFIRKSFGNKAGAVIAGEVFEERKVIRALARDE